VHRVAFVEVGSFAEIFAAPMFGEPLLPQPVERRTSGARRTVRGRCDASPALDTSGGTFRFETNAAEALAEKFGRDPIRRGQSSTPESALDDGPFPAPLVEQPECGARLGYGRAFAARKGGSFTFASGRGIERRLK